MKDFRIQTLTNKLQLLKRISTEFLNNMLKKLIAENGLIYINIELLMSSLRIFGKFFLLMNL